MQPQAGFKFTKLRPEPHLLAALLRHDRAVIPLAAIPGYLTGNRRMMTAQNPAYITSRPAPGQFSGDDFSFIEPEGFGTTHAVLPFSGDLA